MGKYKQAEKAFAQQEVKASMTYEICEYLTRSSVSHMLKFLAEPKQRHIRI